MARLLTIAAVVVLAAGCAEATPASIDSVSIISALPESVFPDDPSLLEMVECAELLEEVIEQSVVCGAMLHGQPVSIEVMIDSEAHAIPTLREPVVELAAIEDQAALRLSTDLGIEVTVTCPGTYVVEQPEMSIDCRAIHDDQPIDFRARRSGAEGAWTFDYVQ